MTNKICNVVYEKLTLIFYLKDIKHFKLQPDMIIYDFFLINKINTIWQSYKVISSYLPTKRVLILLLNLFTGFIHTTNEYAYDKIN